MKDTIKYGLILGFICFLASSVLAVVNGITEPKILAQKQKEQEASLNEVLPQSEGFKAYYENDAIIYYAAYDRNKRLNGFVLKTHAKGYSAAIEAMVGLTLNLEISDIRIISQNETPGLGTRITETAFLVQFKGKPLDMLSEVQAIAGATVSSSALMRSVREKIAEVKDKLLVEVRNAR